MFYGDKSLIDIDFSFFDTSNLVEFSYMFFGCSSLTSLDLSYFNTSKVTNFIGIFDNCYNLKYIDISNFSSESYIKDKIYIFPGIISNGTIYYNSKSFDKELIDTIFKYWEKIDVNSYMDLLNYL